MFLTCGPHTSSSLYNINRHSVFTKAVFLILMQKFCFYKTAKDVLMQRVPLTLTHTTAMRYDDVR